MGSVPTDMHQSGSHPNPENVLYMKDPSIRVSPGHGGQEFPLTDPSQRKPPRERRNSSYLMDRMVTILVSYRDTTV